MKKTIISICAASLLCGTIISTPREAVAGAASAYIAKTSINLVMLAVGLYTMLVRYGLLIDPLVVESSSPFWPALDYAGGVAALAQAGITQWMDESGKILATFTGDKGHVTDKWVGPPNINETVYVMDEFMEGDVASFNVDIPVVDVAYEGLKDPEQSSARELARARREANLAENQSNTGGAE